MVTIVTIQSKRYLVDVGFSSSGPTYPVPLQDNYTALNIEPSISLMLKRGHIPDNTSRDPEHQLWIFHVRFTDDMPWTANYCFSDQVEFLPPDFDTMNFFVSRSPSSFFTQTVMCLKFLMADDGSEKIIGDITLFGNEIKMRRYGKSSELMKIESEADRVLALEKYLGVKLSGPEKQGIKNMVSSL